VSATLIKDVTTKKEDYSDLLALVDARALPFTSAVNKSSAATNPRFDWTADTYAAPKLAGVIDGQDVTSFSDEFANRGKLSNYVQIFERTPMVSTLTQDASDMPGAANPIQAATAKALVEIKRDMESVFLSSNDAQVDTGSVPYLTCGLDLWISTTGPTVASCPSNQRPASAQVITTATASLDEVTDMQGILRAIFDAVGMVSEEYMLLAGSVLRARITEMTRTDTESSAAAVRVRTFSGPMDNQTITSTTTVFRGDFGSFTVTPSSWIGMSGTPLAPDTDRGYLLDMSKVRLRYNQRPTVTPLPNLGGGERRLVRAIAGLQVDSPKGFGKFKP